MSDIQVGDIVVCRGYANAIARELGVDILSFEGGWRQYIVGLKLPVLCVNPAGGQGCANLDISNVNLSGIPLHKYMGERRVVTWPLSALAMCREWERWDEI